MIHQNKFRIRNMNRFFRRLIALTSSSIAVIVLIMMLRFGSPVFKGGLIIAIITVVWILLNYLKADRKKALKEENNNHTKK
jgi:chromate transport protein ChrA